MMIIDVGSLFLLIFFYLQKYEVESPFEQFNFHHRSGAGAEKEALDAVTG